MHEKIVLDSVTEQDVNINDVHLSLAPQLVSLVSSPLLHVDACFFLSYVQ